MATVLFGKTSSSPQLTQVLPAEGRLTQQLCETGHVPEAQVDSLTRQRVHAMSSVPAKEAKIKTLLQRRGVEFSKLEIYRDFLPDKSGPVSNILGRVTDAEREHDAGLGADAGHTRRKLSR